MEKNINGIFVYTAGDPMNKPVVFIHGFPHDSSMWEEQVDHLKDEFFCVVYDVRGHGKSYVGDGQYTMEFFVDDLFAVIDDMKLVKPVICGLSMGGYIALRAVEKNQELFGGLILCDTKAEADDNAAKLKRSAGINQINTEGLIKFCDQFVATCFADEVKIEDEEFFLATIHKTHKHNPVGIKGALIAIMSRTDTTPFLSEIKIPTLVICGSFDKLTPPIVMRAMAEKISNSEFGVIARSGHLTAIENPDAVNDLIHGFLKRNVK